MTSNLPAKQPAKKTRVRISDEMRRCLEIMANEGLNLPLAAEKAGIHRDTAVRNMRKPHVLQLFNKLVKDVKDNAAQQAYLRINHASQAAESERLRFDASRWVAGVEGVTPVTRLQAQHLHSHVFGGFSYPDLEGDASETDLDA